MKTRIRFLSVLLAAVLAFSALSLSTAAPVSAETESLMICACDSTDGWTKINGMPNNPFSITTERAQAQSDDGAIGANTGYGLLKAYYEFPEAIDASGYTAIEWDVCYTGAGGIDEVLTTYATVGYVRIFSNGNSPTNNQSNSLVFRLDALEVTPINNYWAHLKATFENATVKRNFDPTALTAFRYYTSENTYIDSVSQSGVTRLDNIMLTGKEVGEAPETTTITDCEDVSNWASESPENASLQLASGRGKDDSNAIYAAGGYGALRKLTYTLPAAKNISAYSTIEWDMQALVNVSSDPKYGNDEFADIASAYSSYMAIELSDGTNTAKLGFDSWEVGDLATDKYRHIAVSFENVSINLSAITSVSIYVLPLGTGTVDTSVLNAFFRFDNFIVSNNPVTVNSGDFIKVTEMLIEDCEDKSGWSLNNNANSGNMTVNPNGVTGNAIQAWGQKGAVPSFKYTFDTPVDLHRHGYIDFDVRFLTSSAADMWPEISELYADTIKVTLTDSDGNYFNYNLPKINISEPGVNNWYKFTVSFNRASSSDLDFSKIKSFAILISTVADNSASSNVNMRVDNIRVLPQKNLVLGDVNGDEEVNTKDMVRLKWYFVGKDVELFEEYADIYSSGSINVLDLEELEKLILGTELSSKSYSLLSMSGWSSVVKP